ncbi:DUF1329 domain-containing protein [Kangiella sp. HZ709]|uniref:DUF1329 domain-containing protein n=1 Tax=Kangiella sp. HZ709 TaxID=2666328 RepID=UPI0012B06ECB|nr:DUF1329 domain-containing protein [Kangiella sp. HZ709]MRX28519.1 DUF1329 domain-containing protein [Kangiella sp. HZ709]
MAKIMNKWLLATAVASTFLGATADAKVTAEKAAQLGGDTYTPMGAIKAGNADGSIPAWNGGITSVPQGYTKGDHHPDPFAGDQVLFTIDAQNYTQYQDNLSPGQIALFKAYPEQYKMKVYPTRRTASYPQYVYDAIKRNAPTATLVDGGNGIKGAAIGTPFPFPETGLELIWNHLTRYRGVTVQREAGQASPQADGDYTLVKIKDELDQIYNRPGMTPEKLEDGNVLFLFRQYVTAPARLAGTALLVHETMDQVKEPRKAWIYNAGRRRVQRAPNVAYDAPGTASDGLRTTDDFDMYNGAPDRYNWTIKGKKEMFIPYNTYQLHSDELSYDDIIRPGVINQDLVRYEKHRVWVLEAALKEDTRHQYGKRVFYIDEDSWQVSASDIYNEAGDLWRVAMAHAINYYEVPALWSTLETYYDLPSGRYLAIGLDNQEDMYDFDTQFRGNHFTPSALRRLGRR